MTADRMEELEAKAKAEGLTDDEAAELGRLYAERAGEAYRGPEAGVADEEDEEEQSEVRRELEAAAEADRQEEWDRTQAVPPTQEPDFEQAPEPPAP